MKRVISLWLPRLATDRLAPRNGTRSRSNRSAAKRDRLLATTRDVGGRVLLSAVDAVAAGEGISPGMALADARALCPDLRVVAADPAGERATHRRIVAWCGRYTPWVAPDGLDGVFLDATGCAHLFGGEAAMLEDICGRLETFGFAARAAIAETPGAAWALARYGRTGAVAAPGSLDAVLGPLPVAAIRLDPATVAGLERLGLARVADLCAVPRRPLARRFGSGLLRRIDQAHGRIPEPISPIRPPARYCERLAFADPIGLPDDIARGLSRLLDRLCARLARDGRGCRRLVLTLYRVDGTVQEAAIGAARPDRRPERLARLFAERLASLDPGFGVDAMVLAAPVTEPSNEVQANLSGAAAVGTAADVAPLVDRLANRLGTANVFRVVPVHSHRPERAIRKALPLSDDPAVTWPVLPPRPLRLFRQPEPIGAVMLADTEGTARPPVRFVWRRTVHRVRLAEGPERIAPEWWRAREVDRKPVLRTRDYWRVEDEEGRRFWIFRNDLPATAAGGQEPAWYLHGLFV